MAIQSSLRRPAISFPRPTTTRWPSSDLRHGPGPLDRRRRGEGGIYGEGFVHEVLNDHQHLETTHTLSQGSVRC
jgi:hypothetical protein